MDKRNETIKKVNGVMPMNAREYHDKAREFANYDNPEYPFWALIEEIGEFAGKVAKSMRGDCVLDREALLKEAGDVQWQLNESVAKFKESPKPFSDKLISLMDLLAIYSTNDPHEDHKQLWDDYIEDHWDICPDRCRGENIKKLTDRKNRNVIKGSGDNR